MAGIRHIRKEEGIQAQAGKGESIQHTYTCPPLQKASSGNMPI